eukprot:6408871-Pyramimonas_sp.AAC.1
MPRHGAQSRTLPLQELRREGLAPATELLQHVHAAQPKLPEVAQLCGGRLRRKFKVSRSSN